MNGMTAVSSESLRIKDTMHLPPTLLATVVAMLNNRYEHLAKTGKLEHATQTRFLAQREVVGRCIQAMQNCAEKPALSIGYAHVVDQMAIMSTPYAVLELFEIVGIKPEVEADLPSVTFMSLNRHTVHDFHARTGVKIIFSEQA